MSPWNGIDSIRVTIHGSYIAWIGIQNCSFKIFRPNSNSTVWGSCIEIIFLSSFHPFHSVDSVVHKHKQNRVHFFNIAGLFSGKKINNLCIFLFLCMQRNLASTNFNLLEHKWPKYLQLAFISHLNWLNKLVYSRLNLFISTVFEF